MTNEKYVVFTGNNCRWCNKAKALLTLEDKEFQEFNIDEAYTDRNGRETRPHRSSFFAFGFKTVPQVFQVAPTGISHIGGFHDLESFLGRD